jgi:hypothetical protein
MNFSVGDVRVDPVRRRQSFPSRRLARSAEPDEEHIPTPEMGRIKKSCGYLMLLPSSDV